MDKLLQVHCDDFELFDGEKVELVIRRHWAMDFLIFCRWLFLGLGVSGFIISGYFILGGSIENSVFWVILFFVLLYLTVITISVFVQWLNATLDIIFVTSDRVIDISQIDFFHRNIIETRLANIQDATGEVKGFLNTIFDWGMIQIRTANDIADFSIDAVQSPQMQSRKIFQLANKARENESMQHFTMQEKIKQKRRDTENAVDIESIKNSMKNRIHSHNKKFSGSA